MNTLARSSMRDRLRAGGTHLAVCSVIALLTMALIFLGWYPAPLAQAQGVSRLLLILVAVDVTVGPLITVLIFDRAKKSLSFDLAVIACCQLAFLLYGLHAIFAGRPAIIAYNVDRFDVVQAQDVDRQSLERSIGAGKAGLPWLRPRIVYAQLPSDRDKRQELMFQAVVGGSDLPQMAEWYEPYENGKDDVAKHVRPLSELRKVNGMDEVAWADFLGSLNRQETELGYLPLRAKSKDGAVIVDARTAEIIRITMLEPKWS
ncbi:MAG: TfpX/TfpZ family type IV pilin accessory protein [Sinimarinibacterium sp.]|jgi:hypothetical protein